MRLAARSFAMVLGCTIFAGGFAAATDPEPATPPPPVDESQRVYLETEYLFVESPEIQAYLQSVIDKLVEGRKEKFTKPRLLIYSASDFDGRSDANGNLLVSTEALRLIDSEDELAALLSHEMAHVVAGDAAKKSLLQRFPVGVNTMTAMAAAGDRLVRAQKQNTDTPTESKAARRGLRGSQDLSEFWGDFLAPNWNKKQEREADHVGFDMMVAAGYDPAAFSAFFAKLNAAQLKRGARMAALKDELKALAKAGVDKKAANAASPTSTGGNELQGALKDLGNTMSDKAVDTLFDSIAKMTADYDSPEQRYELIQKYASALGRRSKTMRSPRFAEILRNGPGGTLLTTDANAQALMTALQAEDDAAATEAAQTLLPAGMGASAAGPASAVGAANSPGARGAAANRNATGASGGAEGAGAKSVANATGETQGNSKGKPSGKGAQAAKSGAAKRGASVAVAAIPRPASPHLNLALAQWFESRGQVDPADQRLTDWLQYPQAPALTYVQRASYQSGRGEYDAAISTLQEGARRIGSSDPFLPAMVAVAHDAKNVGGAQEYARQCWAAEQKNKSIGSKILGAFQADPLPSGLYAECVARLEEIPPPADAKTPRLADLPTNALKSLQSAAEKK